MLINLLIIISLIWLALAAAALCIPNAYASFLLPIIRVGNIFNAGLTALLGLLGLILFQTVSFSFKFLLPHLSAMLCIDPLAAFFISLLGFSLLGISCFAAKYFQHFSINQQKYIYGFMALFVLAMLFVVVANDIFTFLFAWELMTLNSYFLVVGLEPTRLARKAGFLYLGIAHVGFLFIAASFFLLALSQNLSIAFPQLMPVTNVGFLANIIFVFALIGFGAKAGLFPLHVWLPEAHPQAPSPISGLMSGVMLKMAIYGLLRFCFQFLALYQQSWWGYLLIFVGLVTMFFGVVHAALQTDMKRLLAYSSMENLGFITVALGLSLLFYQYHLGVLANLALLVTLLHSLNHSLFKPLLFLGTGSILHATGERNLGKLGGLIKKMPWVAVWTLIGLLAMAGLPLFNGFVSEWLYLNLFFGYSVESHFILAILTPLIVALSVLVFGLAGFVIVKFFGIAFLGQPRESQLKQTVPISFLEQVGLGWLAILCLLLGIYPNYIIHLIQAITINLLPMSLHAVKTTWGLSFYAHPVHAGFNPILLATILLILLGLIYFILKKFFPVVNKRVAPWDCGYKYITSRMEDTGAGVSQS